MDKETENMFGIVIAIVIIIIIFFGMEGVNKINGFAERVLLGKGLFGEISDNGVNGIGVSYEPPVIPLVISYELDSGIILSAKGKIPTPIGTFAIYKNITFPEMKTLTIVLGNEKHIYDLEDNIFEVQIPNDKEGKSTIEYDGNGNILVIIPDPIFDFNP